MNDTYPYKGVLTFSDGTTAEINVAYAKSFFERFMGLMGKPSVPEGSGLLFEKCRSIHMMFMRVPLDVLWLEGTASRGYRVVGLSRNVRPWTGANGSKGSKHAMEFAVGGFDKEPVSLQVLHQ